MSVREQTLPRCARKVPNKGAVVASACFIHRNLVWMMVASSESKNTFVLFNLFNVD